MRRTIITLAAAASIALACKGKDDADATKTAPAVAAKAKPRIKFEPPFDGKPLSTRMEDDGLAIHDFVIGEGEEAVEDGSVAFAYTGYSLDGKVVDTSRKSAKNKAQRLRLGTKRGIPAFHRGIKGMKAGGKRRLIVPSPLAYGADGKGKVQPDMDLVYTIELLAADPPMPAPRPEEAYKGDPKWTSEHTDGLEVYEFDRGNGEPVQEGDKLFIHMIGKLKDGSVFENTHAEKPVRIKAGARKVLEGLDLGLRGAKRGSLRRIEIPPQLGYGKKGREKVPADAPLTYLVEVMEIHRAAHK